MKIINILFLMLLSFNTYGIDIIIKGKIEPILEITANVNPLVSELNIESDLTLKIADITSYSEKIP